MPVRGRDVAALSTVGDLVDFILRGADHDQGTFAGGQRHVDAAWILSSGQGHNENTRSALAHVLSDAAGSVAAILAAVMVLGWGWQRADPLISVVLTIMIFWSAWKLVARTAGVLMEGTPAGLHPAELERTIRGTAGVGDVHDLHAWRISEGFDVVTVHVILDGTRHGTEVAQEVCAGCARRTGSST